MIKKSGSKFVVTDSSGSKILGTHPTKEKAQKQLAAIEISKAKHMKETKQFKAFRNTLNESEYKETLTGYPNRSLDTDVGAIKFNAQFIANANAMLNALSKYSYLNTTDALVKIRARLNVLLLDFPWTPRVWSGYAQVPPATPGENSSVVGLFTLPLTRFGRVDGYDALTGGIRFDGRAGSQDGFQEFTLTVKVELGDDSMYRVTAFVSPKEEPVVAEEGVEVDGDTIAEMAQTPARVKEMQGKLDTAASKIRNKVGDQPAAKKKYNSILSKDRNEFFAKKMYGKGGKEVKEELVGGQKKLDANKNKKLDSQDFKLLRSKKSVKEDVTTEFTTGLPIMDPALGSNIADQSGKGTKRIKKTVEEAAKTPKKTVKKRTILPGAADQSAKSHAIKDRLNKYGMRW
mgnify:CR=1 FL=1|tara:strand:- start:918 stop:2123 length:1206 start_codon:yes stop_codon:yes gene_type:complete